MSAGAPAVLLHVSRLPRERGRGEDQRVQEWDGETEWKMLLAGSNREKNWLSDTP